MNAELTPDDLDRALSRFEDLTNLLIDLRQEERTCGRLGAQDIPGTATVRDRMRTAAEESSLALAEVLAALGMVAEMAAR